MIQVKLKELNKDVHLTTWVEKRKDLKLGSYISLKDEGYEGRWFEVLALYSTMEKSELHTDWKVGGLR